MISPSFSRVLIARVQALRLASGDLPSFSGAVLNCSRSATLSRLPPAPANSLRTVSDGAPSVLTNALELVPFTIEGATDNQGRPLTSLIVKDGAKASALVKTEGAPSETVLRLLAGAGGSLDKVALREQFNTAPENEGKSPDAKRKACTRAINTLENDGLIICTENAISLSPESDRLDVGSLV